MGFLDRLGSFLKGEAADIGEMANEAKDRFDAELTAREAELAMSPSEKIESLQRGAVDTDGRIEDILDKARVGSGDPDAGDGPGTDAGENVPTESRERTENSPTTDQAGGGGSESAGETAGASKSQFDKSDAELRYAEARSAADDLLDELRGELRDDGEI